MSQPQKKTSKKSIKENMMPQQNPMVSQEPTMDTPMMQQEPSWDHPGCDDKVGKIYVVLKPNPGTSHEDLVHQTHTFGMGQFDPASVHGVYSEEEEANLVAEAATAAFHKHLAEIERKKDHVMNEIEKHISRLQKEINAHMKEATDRPELSEGHHELAERKMNMIKGLRDKHKAVKATKKEVPEIKEK